MASPAQAMSGRGIEPTRTVRNPQRHAAAQSPRVSKVHARRGSTDAAARRTLARTADTRQMVRTTRTSKAQEATATVTNIERRMRAVRASGAIASMVLPFCGIQFFFGLLQFAGFGSEYAGEQFLWGVGATVIPGTSVFGAGYIIAAIMGIGSMMGAALIYIFNGISLGRNGVVLGFGFFLICSILPFLNIFPWLALWIPIVIYAQK